MSRGLQIALVSAVLVLALGVAGLAGYVFFLMPNGAAASSDKTEAASAKADTTQVTFKMKNFVTNLSDQDRIRYIDVTVALGLKSADSEAFVKAVEPQIRHVILSTVRNLSSTDLAGAQGRDKLAEAIASALSKDLLKGHLANVYITDMVVQ